MIFRALDYIKIGAGIALGAALSAVPVYFYGKSIQRSETRAEAALDALDRIQTMEENNASFSKLSDRGRCIVFMRDSGLPTDLCDGR
jgi:hypothetical protein